MPAGWRAPNPHVPTHYRGQDGGCQAPTCSQTPKAQTPLSARGRWEGKSGMKLAGNPMDNEAESHKYITRLWTSVLRLVSHPHNSRDLHAASTARMGKNPAPQPRKKHPTPWVSGHEHNLGRCLFYFLGGEQTDSLHGLC